MIDNLPPLPSHPEHGRVWTEAEQRAIRAYAAQAVAAGLDAREFVHAESSRSYARLASAVRAGADDATLASLLRAEVNARRTR